MKSFKNIAILLIVIFYSLPVVSQTSDQIIAKYIQSIGGADVVKSIKSICMESSSKMMGINITTKTTILNGIGFKTETTAMGNKQVACYTNNSGWMKEKNNKAEIMPNEQFEMGKSQIIIGSPFIDYSVQGYKITFIGKEKVDGEPANRIRMTRKSFTADYWFDLSTGYLKKSFIKTKMEGKEVEITMLYSEYTKTKKGYVMPIVTETKMGFMFSMTNRITEYTFDEPVSESVFRKPD